jgi:hypothetical protein
MDPYSPYNKVKFGMIFEVVLEGFCCCNKAVHS